MRILEINDLSFGYTKSKILKNLNLDIKEQESVIICGDNGSGKSTLLKLILREITGYNGSIKIFEKDLKTIKDFKDVGYVPQVERTNGISFPVTVKELVSLNFYREFGFIKKPNKRIIEKVREKLKELDIIKYENTPFNELSGGLKQRVMIARALLKNPKLLILDEPTAGVDLDNKIKFMKIIENMNINKNITILMVSHEIDFIYENLKIDNIYKMDRGKLENVRI